MSFDELFDTEEKSVNRSSHPFWAIADQEDDAVLKWLNGELAFLKQDSRDRIQSIHKNVAAYKGIQYETQVTRDSTRRDVTDDSKNKISRVVINHLYDFTESHVSSSVKYKPAVSITAANPEESNDVISAKMSKNLLDHIWDSCNFREFHFPKLVRDSKIAGEGYLFVEWDAFLGDMHPDYKKKLESSNSNSVSVMTSDGKEVTIDRPINIGDVAYELVPADEVYLEKKNDFSLVNYAFRVKKIAVDEIRADFPDKKDLIKAETETQVYDYGSLGMEKLQNEVLLFKFYHKPSKNCQKGAYIIYTKNAILERGDYKYRHKRLPFVKLDDVEVPNERHAVSFYQNVKPLTSAINNLTNMIMRNQLLVSHPKWMMPAGAARLEQLGNDITIVQYKGPIAPQLVQMNPTPGEVFSFRQLMKEESQQLAGVHGVSRGEPPPGVKAGVAMQFLNEQENERRNAFALKVNALLVSVAEMTISVAGQFYKEHDERMIKIQGRANEWMLKRFDPKWLHTTFDIRVNNSSALPESKAQRTQNILDLSERFPELFSPEQVLDMLDMSASEKFVDEASMAVRTAETENNDLSEGVSVPAPEDYEDHYSHWRTHMKMLQSPNFRLLSKAIQKKYKDHIMATEMFMFDLAKKNPKFAQKIATLDLFPMFYWDDSMAMAQTGQMSSEQSAAAMPQGAPSNQQAQGPAQQQPTQDEVGQQTVNP